MQHGKDAPIYEESGIIHTAGIVIVGDEILSGKIADVNSGYLARELHSIGWQVLRVSSSSQALVNEMKCQLHRHAAAWTHETC